MILELYSPCPIPMFSDLKIVLVWGKFNKSKEIINGTKFYFDVKKLSKIRKNNWRNFNLNFPEKIAFIQNERKSSACLLLLLVHNAIKVRSVMENYILDCHMDQFKYLTTNMGEPNDMKNIWKKLKVSHSWYQKLV